MRIGNKVTGFLFDSDELVLLQFSKVSISYQLQSCLCQPRASRHDGVAIRHRPSWLLDAFFSVVTFGGIVFWLSEG